MRRRGGRQAAILGIGTAVPPHAIRQRDAAELITSLSPADSAQHHRTRLLYRRAGVQSRRSVLLDGVGLQSFFLPTVEEDGRGPTTSQRMERYAAEAPPLAVRAAELALSDATTDGRFIDHVIVVTCTGFSAPGVDVALIKRLGLPPTVARTQVGFMGCYGAFSALRIASSLVCAGQADRVLVCAVELCSLHLCYEPQDGQGVANALFADGAAAMVVGVSRGWRFAAHGSRLFPDSEDAMRWEIGDHGFDMMLSPRVPALLAAHLQPWLVEWLSTQRLELSAVASWAVHPGGPRILEAVASCLGLPPARLAASSGVLAEYGNMSSATILFILERMRRAGERLPCIALGFGPGLAAEALLMKD